MASKFRNGDVKIANEILDQLAIRASEEVNGVHSAELNGSMMGLVSNAPKSQVSLVDNKLCVDLTVSLDKNVNVRKTVKEIQENVIRVIESMTGLVVGRVNVTIPSINI